MSKLNTDKCPLCKKKLNFDDIMCNIESGKESMAPTCPYYECPHCGKGLRIYLSIYEIEEDY